jgi:hypothetical protein
MRSDWRVVSFWGWFVIIWLRNRDQLREIARRPVRGDKPFDGTITEIQTRECDRRPKNQSDPYWHAIDKNSSYPAKSEWSAQRHTCCPCRYVERDDEQNCPRPHRNKNRYQPLLASLLIHTVALYRLARALEGCAFFMPLLCTSRNAPDQAVQPIGTRICKRDCGHR